MSRSKKKKRRAQARAQTAQQTQSRGRLAKRGWLLVVLVVGLLAIFYVPGVFDRRPDTPPSERASLPPDESASKASTGASPAIAESATIPTAGQRDWNEIDDPAKDGWPTEVLHKKVKKQLQLLGEQIISSSPTSAALSSLLSPAFRCSPLRHKLTTVYQAGGVTVERRTSDSGENTYNGPDGLVSAIAELREPFGDSDDMRFEFKVVSVEPDREESADADTPIESLQTEQLFSLSGRTPSGMVEQHATWTTSWATSKDGTPRLLTISVDDYEESRTDNASGPLFVDCTESVLGKNASYQKQILRGLNHWLSRKPFRNLLSILNTPGIAVGDVNGDGLDDLFLCQEALLPNRLYLQQPDGSALDVSAAWGVDWINDTRSALLIDLDNDGDQDLVITVPSNLVLVENEGNQRFRIRATLPVSEDPTSLSAFDYDLDGRLDIYVCAYQPDEGLSSSAGNLSGIASGVTIYHDANDSAPNSMFRNEIPAGEAEMLASGAETNSGRPWKFVDVTVEIGLDAANRRWSLAVASEDYDNDGDGDLYVANDFGRDNIYRNDVTADGRRAFVEVGEQARAEQAANGMAITWSDYDLDGWIDVYVSNMWSSAGHRIVERPQFMPHANDAIRQRMQHFAVGNTLLRNRGDGIFDDRSIAEGVNRGRWAWGSQFFDLNNDGWDDLVVANGYITGDDSDDL